MREGRTVVYLSSYAVDGHGVLDPFMLQELPWLRAHFDHVLIVSYYGVAELTEAQRAEPFHISFSDTPLAKWKAWLRAPFARELWQELAHLRRDGALSILHCIKLFLFCVRGQRMHLWLERMLADSDMEKVTLYAYWMSYEAYAAALSKRRHGSLRFIARGHAFEIDKARNDMNPYLMKRMIAAEAESMFFISEYAKAQYLSYMQGAEYAEKLHVVPMGSKGKLSKDCKEPPFFAEGKWQMVSCAAISEIKQLPVLIDALSQWGGAPIDWLHIGGGEQEAEIRAYAAEKLGEIPYISYQITGRLENDKVQEIYEKHPFDVFVSTSRMEGVPVSMMEAMRFGIPIIAPRVGGIPELVDERAGILYEPVKGAQGVLVAMRAFASLPRERILAMRRCAQTRWNEDFRSDALMPLLFSKEAAAAKERGASGHE